MSYVRSRTTFEKVEGEWLVEHTICPQYQAPENIEKPHGRGVFLMRHLADECDFEDDGRIVVLTFNEVLA